MPQHLEIGTHRLGLVISMMPQAAGISTMIWDGYMCKKIQAIIFGSMIPMLVGSGLDRHIMMFPNRNHSSILLPKRVGCISRLSTELERSMTTWIRLGSLQIQTSSRLNFEYILYPC